MKIDVELQMSYGRLLKREPVFISDDIFKLSLNTSYQLSELIVEFDNGGKKITTHHSYTNEIPIPREVKFAGVLEVKITLLALGVAVKTWHVEPIVLKEVDNCLSACAEVDELKSKLTEAEKKISLLEAQVKVLEDSRMDMSRQLGELWRIHES